ncbi:MAG: nucleotidyltransferase domain-containing protein [Armatimonadaceae bacterium]
MKAESKKQNQNTYQRLRPQVTEELLDRIRQRLVEQFHPERIVLFGSYAYGKPDSNSDVDLMVIMDSEESMARRIARIAPVVRVPFLPMDLLVLTPAELSERLSLGDSFLEEILTNGRTLYINPAT